MISIRAVFLYEKNGIFHYIDERLASYSRYNNYGHCNNDKRLKYLHKKLSLNRKEKFRYGKKEDAKA